MRTNYKHRKIIGYLCCKSYLADGTPEYISHTPIYEDHTCGKWGKHRKNPDKVKCKPMGFYER